MNLKNDLIDLIKEENFDQKIIRAKQLSDYLNQDHIDLESISSEEFLQIKEPGRPENYQVLSPRKVPIRRNLKDIEQRVNFLHAIANIELLAIELPALGFLRFGCQDHDLIISQIEVIIEEAHHFELLKKRLKELNCDYGSIPVHHGLWDFALRCESELEHQILIPCFLEARGLDVCPDFVKQFQEINDQDSAQILQLILDEEIIHVRKGIEYLNKKSLELNLTPEELFDQVLKTKMGSQRISKIPINYDYRHQAGFSDLMLESLKG